MQCPECGETVENETGPCPECGAELAVAHHRERRVRAGFAIALIAVFLVIFVAALLRPAGPVAVRPGSVSPTSSIETTVDPVRAAIEKTIAGFYATIDAGEPVTLSPYVYSKGLGGTIRANVASSTAATATPTTTPATTATAEATITTKFSIARAVVGSGTADVYGRESRSVIATPSAEVEFRLRRVAGTWLISSWQVARVETITPEALALSSSTSRDIVGTLLEARRVGDGTTIRMLTTKKFQLRHSSWFDGADQSALLLAYSITGAQPAKKAYEVTADEQWLPTPLKTTYTVVMVNGEILVDAWTWKQ